MGYIVRAKSVIYGRRVRYGKRIFKTLAGCKKSIKSPSGKAYIKKYKLTEVTPVKQRKTK